MRNLLLIALCFAVLSLWSIDPARAVGPDEKVHAKAVAAGVAFLKSSQTKEGTWGGKAAPGMTGLAVTALARSKVAPSDEVVARALTYIESLIDAKEGHIAGKAEKGGHNYPTSANLIALAAADEKGRYKATIAKAAAYLKGLQWDEGEGKKPEDPPYGGAGYGRASRPDLSNTIFFLDALVAAGVPKSDEVFKKGAVYVSRCQNLKGEHNSLEWAGKINDGSFIYTATVEGETRGDAPKDGSRPGYGSMTFAGLRAMHYCGVAKDDPRAKKAMEWISKNYSVDTNPGMPPGSGARGLYYYLMTMAKTLDALGVDEVTDAAGKKHDWRAEITQALANRQKPNGSWGNDIPNWMETNPDLCTCYALIALSHCKAK